MSSRPNMKKIAIIVGVTSATVLTAYFLRKRLRTVTDVEERGSSLGEIDTSIYREAKDIKVPNKNIVLNKKFGYRSTALEVVKELKVDISEKVAIITGASSGLGYETALALAHGGAHVILAVRDLKKTATLVEKIKQLTKNQKIEAMSLELDSFKKVRQFVEEFKAKNLPLHFLINNAGIMACPYRLSDDGYESQFATNHLGHFLLTNLLVPILAKSHPSRVVCLSSVGHKRQGINFDDINFVKNYDKWIAYGQSKTANILFAREFNRRFQKKGIKAFSVHPGGIMTSLQQNLTDDEKKKLGWIDAEGKLNEAFKTPEQGASTTIYAALAPELNKHGGAYLEDCSIAVINQDRISGLAPHAVDDEAAVKLWEYSEKFVQQEFPPVD